MLELWELWEFEILNFEGICELKTLAVSPSSSMQYISCQAPSCYMNTRVVLDHGRGVCHWCLPLTDALVIGNFTLPQFPQFPQFQQFSYFLQFQKFQICQLHKFPQFPNIQISFNAQIPTILTIPEIPNSSIAQIPTIPTIPEIPNSSIAQIPTIPEN